MFGLAVVLLAEKTVHDWISSPARAQQPLVGEERTTALENRTMRLAGLCYFPGYNLDDNQKAINTGVQALHFEFDKVPSNYITVVDGQSYTGADLAAMSEEQRRTVANGWVAQQMTRVGMDTTTILCPELGTDGLADEIKQIDGDIDQLDEEVSALENEVITFTATLDGGDSDLPPVYTGPTNSWDHNIQPGYGFQMQCQSSDPGATLNQLYTLTCMRIEP